MKRLKYLYIAITLVFILAIAFFVYHKNAKYNQKRQVQMYQADLDIVYGNADADLTLYMFSSYTCSFCRKFFTDVFPKLQNDYLNNGKLKLVVKLVDYTNNEHIKNSLKLAVCINEYGNFEKLNELLLLEPKVVFTDEFGKLIDDLTTKDIFVEACMYGGESENYILQNFALFKTSGFTGTPTFVINNNVYKGFREYDRFKDIIEKELKDALH